MEGCDLIGGGGGGVGGEPSRVRSSSIARNVPGDGGGGEGTNKDGSPGARDMLSDS